MLVTQKTFNKIIERFHITSDANPLVNIYLETMGIVNIDHVILNLNRLVDQLKEEKCLLRNSKELAEENKRVWFWEDMRNNDDSA